MSQKERVEKERITEALKKGYKEMADINLELAQTGIESDNESLSLCEEKLTECE